MGRADHPCLAARPTSDGRPYRRQLGQHAVLPLPQGVCLKVGKECSLLSHYWLLVYRFTTPHLHPYPNTCTRYPMAETWDLRVQHELIC